MAIFKSTIFFEGPGHGWTETYWQELPAADYEVASDSLRALMNSRRLLLGEEIRMKAWRVSLEGTTGDGYLREQNFWGIKQEAAAEEDLAILFTLYDTTRSRRKNVFLRGFWDKVESNAGDYKRNEPDWKANMDKWKANFAIGTIWGWWGIQSKVTRNVQTYVVLATQQIKFTFMAPLFTPEMVGTNQQVRFQGINGKSNLNGLQVVKVLTTDTCETFLPISNVPYQFGGKGTIVTKGYIKALFPTDKRITTRKVGAPLLESRGHQKARPRT